MTDMESILEEAQSIVRGARQADYGNPRDNHDRTACLYRAFIEAKYGAVVPISAEDVCWLNVLQKMSREMHGPKRDNLVDIAGYTANVDMMRCT